MPSLDIVSRVNFPELDNAVNNTLKAIAARFDFKGAHCELTVDKKEKKLKVVAEDTMKMKGIRDMFESAVHKRGLDLKIFKWGDNEHSLGGKVKSEVKIQDGIEQEVAKQIVRIIKDSKMKVQAAIQGDAVRITGTKRDDLQAAMALIRKDIPEMPLSFNNFRD